MQSFVASFIKRSVSAAIALGIASATAFAFAFAGDLNILTWKGYADSSFIQDFEAVNRSKVTATYVGRMRLADFRNRSTSRRFLNLSICTPSSTSIRT
ncbi:MAG TPA: hypothetical protein VM661_04755 [Candidatus Sulfotelmatobacter sp.]|jgi:hypothetical protein|nr:hypothetical protein [Candidatus Sulfotelmatobacter sp.]